MQSLVPLGSTFLNLISHFHVKAHVQVCMAAMCECKKYNVITVCVLILIEMFSIVLKVVLKDIKPQLAKNINIQ